MRIHVSKARGGKHQVMIVPGKGSHLAPIQVRTGSRADLLVEVRKVVDLLHEKAGVVFPESE